MSKQKSVFVVQQCGFGYGSSALCGIFDSLDDAREYTQSNPADPWRSHPDEFSIAEWPIGYGHRLRAPDETTDHPTQRPGSFPI